MEKNIQNKSCIIVGGGYSIREAISLRLWEKIKDLDVWSLNFAYLVMPFLPKREVWVDTHFFNTNIDKLQELALKGVKMYAKRHSRQLAIKEINQYFVTRQRSEYWGKEAIDKGIIFYGTMGLSGMFATSLAIAEKYNEIFWLGFDFGNNNNTNNTHFYQDKITVLSTGMGKPEIYKEKNGSIRKDVEDFVVFTKETDVKIWNVSPNSNIPFYEKIDYLTFFNKINENT